MFDKFGGLPLHPLLVHAVVVLVPLLCALSIAYAVLPRFRAQVGWAAVGAAVGAPLTAWFATLSGEKLEARLKTPNYPADALAKIEEHAEFGEMTFYVSIALGLLTLIFVWLTATATGRSLALPSWVTVGLVVALVVLSGVAAYYVFQTGDTGARMVWKTVV